MGLLTIGAFARASRLSAKALRRYDELGLLPPARVDLFTGYRYYDETQLERARLVAWLRRIGMPLARIRDICDLCATDTAAAARDIRAYWSQVEAETSARRDLAAFLVDQLSGKDTDTMSQLTTPLGFRYAARSDRGLVRETNQDAAYAGSRLLAVADGFGGEGAPASTAVIDALKHLEAEGPGSTRVGDLLNALEDAVHRANATVNGFAGSGTTLTAMMWTGSQLALVHIGDTRAHLLRDGDFFQITHDHTVVQAMIDEGDLSPEEAASHPQRAMLLRALDGSAGLAGPDLRLHEARAGDRYLLCSDGLSATVPQEEKRRAVAALTDPGEAVHELVALAHRAGGPDNIACVVADVVAL
ncbi:protein phosphatase [Streptomyces sp. SLBN-118]|uniref:MerR family transcriptional regulator n=1 Tax=Streptomyces sp. SLBN-118 TaxID=2768454 RepID=UPI001151CD04|nr:MerR family transcriptional regulator [Streptomyces sp. SLBN-118]TQK52972.1 protein phosphatase [Streptomyces sp. SLBN-118]